MNPLISKVWRVCTREWLAVGFVFTLGSTGAVGGCSGSGMTFSTPQQGVQELASALQPLDPVRLRRVLGPGSDQVVSSGDEVADQQAAEAFMASFNQSHNVEVDGDAATLTVGKDEWPLPIPLVREGNRWRFDTEAAEDEILARRIGRNELSTIETCRAIVDAQREYAAVRAAQGQQEYAQKFASDPGLRNGLYWPSEEGEAPSPLGSMVSRAVMEGYKGRPAGETGPRPFHGYCYRMLLTQGSSAPGGMRSYMVDGRMTGGFGVVAWPVEYGNSGIMTFMVSDDGIVYQKDLGTQTQQTAESMTAFDPGEGWDIVE